MAKKNKKTIRKCCKCGDPVKSVHSMYCPDCSHLAFRMKERRFSPEAVEGIWNYIREHGRRCFYTQLPLEMKDTTSQWYCVFDHLIPLDPRRIVLTCAMINEMKSALSVREFWYYVKQLADFINEHKKIKKIKLAYWRQHVYLRPQGKSFPAKKPVWPDPQAKKCCLCGKPVFTLRSKYCRRCSYFARRLHMQGFGRKTVEEILDYVRTRGFTCAYTGMRLDMDDERSPWYGVFDCLIPGDFSQIVLTSALFNEMKSDLTIKEFWYYIRQLANYKRKNSKIRRKKLDHWYRLRGSY